MNGKKKRLHIVSKLDNIICDSIVLKNDTIFDVFFFLKKTGTRDTRSAQKFKIDCFNKSDSSSSKCV